MQLIAAADQLTDLLVVVVVSADSDELLVGLEGESRRQDGEQSRSIEGDRREHSIKYTGSLLYLLFSYQPSPLSRSPLLEFSAAAARLIIQRKGVAAVGAPRKPRDSTSQLRDSI